MAEKEGKRKRARTFQLKLRQMLEQGDPLFYWDQDSKCLVVQNVAKFQKELLPRFFSHGNFSSLIRQLNIYQFSKSVDEQNRNRVYFHNKQFSRKFKINQFGHGNEGCELSTLEAELGQQSERFQKELHLSSKLAREKLFQIRQLQNALLRRAKCGSKTKISLPDQ